MSLNEDAYRKLVSSESGGPCATLVRFNLGIAAQGYRVITGLRNFLYSRGLFKIQRAEVPVISVGNITTGGTGKTPLVIWLCNKITSDSRFKVSSSQCAILTRGYKAAQGSKSGIGNFQDEPAILVESCPKVQVVVNPDRVAGAAEAVSRFGAKILIMDDGFQHRRLARDLDIVTIDSMSPFGYGKLLPAGLLREPVGALRRADAAVITRCDQADEEESAQLENKLRRINPEMVIARSIHAPVCAKTIDNKEISLEELKGKKIFAFCGIGNPDAFMSTVKGLGTELVGSKVYNDHYHYTEDCAADIYNQAQRLKADLILTTQKDWISFSSSAKRCLSEEVNCAYLLVELRFISGEKEITRLIENTIAGKI